MIDETFSRQLMTKDAESKAVGTGKGEQRENNKE